MFSHSSPEQFVDALNRAWQQADWPALARFFHPDAVLAPPDLGPSLIGWPEILQTYEDFTHQAVLHEFRVLNIVVHEFAHTQVLQVEFEADYSFEGSRNIDTGTEIYVVEAGTDDQPLIVWRQQLIAATRSA